MAQRLTIGLWILVVLLALPGLFVGTVFDDWHHGYELQDGSSTERIFGLYDFFRSADVPQGRREGVLPWWSDDRLSIAFFRPLSSALLAVNHALGSFAAHVHALIWFALTVFAARRVLQSAFNPAVARWATPLYALFGAHLLPLALMAALHAHVSAAFALLSLECLMRRVHGSPLRWQVLSVALLALGLLGGESAIAVVPLAFAYAVAERGVPGALRALAPHMLLVLAFAALYFAFGYGSKQTATYLQPGTLEFALALPRRWLSLAAGLGTGFAPDVWMYGAEPLLVALGVVGLVCGVLGLRRIAGELEPVARRRLIALCVGALVSLVPLAAGVPGGRLLIVPSIASAALFAMAGRHVAQAFAVGARPRPWLLAAWVALLGVGLNPLFRAFVPLDLGRVSRELPVLARSVGERCQGRTALAVGIPEPNFTYLPMVYLHQPSLPQPAAYHTLSMAPGEHRLTQTAPSRFELEIDGDFLALPWSRNYRASALPAKLALDLRGVKLELLEAAASRTRLALELEPGSGACWLTLRDGELSLLEPSAAAPSSGGLRASARDGAGGAHSRVSAAPAFTSNSPLARAQLGLRSGRSSPSRARRRAA